MMKTRQLFLACLLAGIACGCSRGEVNLKVSPIDLTSRENQLTSRVSRSILSSPDPAMQEQCALFNNRVESFIAGLRDTVTSHLRLFEREGIAGDDGRSYEFSVSDTLFRATDRYISLRLTVYTFSGGAHGMTVYHAFNYDPRARKFLDNEELLDYARKQEIEERLSARLDNAGGCFTDSPTLDATTVINFTTRDMVFTYPPYALGPYACGPAEIILPLEETGSTL
jgi:hypothetical protein